MTTESPAHSETKISGKAGIYYQLLAALLVCVVSYFTIVKNYHNPPNLFWDENYHVAAAQKYIDGIFFLENHPPLGKLSIALGEIWLKPNVGKDTKKFLSTAHIKSTPKDYSFKGMRLLPTLFAAGSCVILFFIFLQVSNSVLLSLFCSLLLLFDNTFIVHSRSAMLESVQIFFMLLFVYLFIAALKNKNTSYWSWIFAGFIAGLAVSVKLNSLILLVLFFVRFLSETLGSRDKGKLVAGAISTSIKGLASTLVMLLVLLFFFYLHFRIADTTYKGKFYEVSSKYQKVLIGKKTDLKSFALFLEEQIKYVDKFNSGVPRLKPDNPKENGSHPAFWPFGKKSISYRWDKTNDGRVKYLKLQCNPLGWTISLLSILLSFSLIGGHRIFGLQIAAENRFRYTLIESFSLLYFAYMATMWSMGRVMYLYHYFIPLIFTFILSPLIFLFLFEKEFQKKNKFILAGLYFIAIAQVISYWHFSAFTYHLPLSGPEFMAREWSTIWRHEHIIW